jgi:hypothetical protein
MSVFELRKRAHDLRGRLDVLQGELAALVEAAATVAAGLDEMETKRPPTIESAVAEVDEMSSEQRKHIDDARQRGKGAGLVKILDAAADLERQQSQLLEQAREKPEPEAKDVLRRYDELERQQLALITDAIGKLDAQGLRSLFDRYRELADQQQKIITEVLGAADR